MRRRVVSVSVFRTQLTSYLDLVKSGEELVLTSHRVPVALVVAAGDDVWVLSPTPPLELPQETPLPPEYHAAAQKHPAAALALVRALAGADEATAERLLKLVKQLLREQTGERQLWLLPGAEVEGMKFPKKPTAKPQARPYQCGCSQVGVMVSGQQVTIHREGEVTHWVGEPGEPKAVNCRDCGWQLTMTRRPFGEGYRVSVGAASPRLFVVQDGEASSTEA